MGSGQWAAGSGQWAMGSGQCAGGATVQWVLLYLVVAGPAMCSETGACDLEQRGCESRQTGIDAMLWSSTTGMLRHKQESRYAESIQT